MFYKGVPVALMLPVTAIHRPQVVHQIQRKPLSSLGHRTGLLQLQKYLCVVCATNTRLLLEPWEYASKCEQLC